MKRIWKGLKQNENHNQSQRKLATLPSNLWRCHLLFHVNEAVKISADDSQSSWNYFLHLDWSILDFSFEKLRENPFWFYLVAPGVAAGRKEETTMSAVFIIMLGRVQQKSRTHILVKFFLHKKWIFERFCDQMYAQINHRQ